MFVDLPLSSAAGMLRKAAHGGRVTLRDYTTPASASIQVFVTSVDPLQCWFADYPTRALCLVGAVAIWSIS